MKRVIVTLSVLCLLAACAGSQGVSRPAAFQPAPDLHVAERETLDGGFSRDYGFWMRSYSHTWADAHTHSFGGSDASRREEQFHRLRNAMYEINITNTATFCRAEDDLAFVAATGRHAPVWYCGANDPDIARLRRYHEKYNIRAVKLHNTSVMKGESEGQTWEFPLGSGNVVPVSIDWMVAPEWMEFFRICEELDIPLTWHATNRYGASPYNFGGENARYFRHLSYDNEYVIGHVRTIMEACPNLKIILAHAGFMGYRKLDGLFGELPNLYIDTSAAFVLHEGDYLTDAERDRLRPFFIKWADRILFGTDANAGRELADETFAEHEVRRHVYHRVKPHKDLITALHLPQEVLDKVAHGNFERIFKMPRTDTWYW